MKLENQVCNLELSKRLKELGVPQESIFMWRKHGLVKEHSEATSQVVLLGDFCAKQKEDVSAFTVAELGEMLPDSTTLTRQAVSGRWRYPSINGSSLYAKTEADARAKMLIYLLENNLINK